MISDKSPVSLKEAGKFLKNIKDVPFPHLLAGSGFIVIIADMAFIEITGKNSEFYIIGIVLVALGFFAYLVSKNFF